MKQLSLITFLLLLSLPVKYSFAQQIEEILQQVEQNIKNTNLLSYHSIYTSINPNVEDSISKVSVTVWLKRVPTDSIFGAYFHVEGKDGHGRFDYFYDKQNSYEIRHEDKKITIFYPHEYPNTPNNPAKARTALSPFNELLIDESFKNTILENHPNITIHQNANQTKWIVTLNYPENKYGQKTTKILAINKSTLQIDQIRQLTKWRGITYKTQINFSDYKQDDISISENIFMSKKYEGYSQEVFKRDSKNKVNLHKSLIGKPAPGFSFKSFSGNKLSLDQFKGKVVLLDFWESWCGYCMLAMPKLNKLQRNYGESELKVIGIVTENKQQIKKLIKNNKLIYPNIYADRNILSDYKVSGRPIYFLIDKNGNIAFVSSGDLEKIENKIKDLTK